MTTPKTLTDMVDLLAPKLNPTFVGTAKGTFKGNLQGNASTATKATRDSNGNVITDTYATKNAVSSGLSNKLDKNANAVSATKATRDGSGNVITTTYVTKEDLKNSHLEVTWESIKNKPNIFTPSKHAHTSADIVDLTDSINSHLVPLGNRTSTLESNFKGVNEILVAHGNSINALISQRNDVDQRMVALGDNINILIAQRDDASRRLTALERGNEQMIPFNSGQLIGIDSPGNLFASTAGTFRLNLSRAGMDKQLVGSSKVITLVAAGKTTLEIQGPVVWGAGSPPVWGDPKTELVLVAYWHPKISVIVIDVFYNSFQG